MVFLEAIRTCEGWGPGKASFINNNPINLRYCVGEQCYATSYFNGSFRVFNTYEDGVAAGIESIRSHAIQWNRTLGEMIEVFSPPSDGNDPAKHAACISEESGIGVHDRLSEVLIF